MIKLYNFLIWLINSTSFIRGLMPFVISILPWEFAEHFGVFYENQNSTLTFFIKLSLILSGILLFILSFVCDLKLYEYVHIFEKKMYELNVQKNNNANHENKKIKLKIRSEKKQKVEVQPYEKFLSEIENLNLTNEQIEILFKKLTSKNEAIIKKVEFLENDEKHIETEEVVNEINSEVIENLNEIFISNEYLEDLVEKQSNEYNRLFPKVHAGDLLKNYIKNQDTGSEGELFVLNYERNELIKKNRSDLAIKVEHISLINDSIGYDILSFDEFGNKKHIEVKSSVGSYKSDFFLTENEMKTINRIENYFIYRVFNLDNDSIKKGLYIINCGSDLINYFTIKPSQYKVTPRKK